MNSKEAALKAYDAIFNDGKVTGTFKGTVRYLDKDGIRYIAQNPNAQSKWARLAKAGDKIMWAIREFDNKWIERVHNKVYTKL